MNDQVFRANHDKVLQTFARREFLDQWNAFSVYCMEVAVAFIHFYEVENGGRLPQGLNPDQLQKKNILVNERLTRRDVEDFRDNLAFNQDFENFYKQLHRDVHRSVQDKQKDVDSVKAELQTAQLEIAQLQSVIDKEKEYSRRMSGALETERADIKAKMEILESAIKDEAGKTTEILAIFTDDKKRAEEVRNKLIDEIGRIKGYDMEDYEDLREAIVKLENMVTGSRDFRSAAEDHAAKQQRDQRLLDEAMNECRRVKDINETLRRDLEQLKKDTSGTGVSGGLPDNFLRVLNTYSEHCAKFKNFEDETFDFAKQNITKHEFGTLGENLKKIFGPIFEYIKGSLFTVHIMQKCVDASLTGKGVVAEYMEQIDFLHRNKKDVPNHFKKNHWKEFWHCVNGLGTAQNWATVITTVNNSLAVESFPQNPKILFVKKNSQYDVLFEGDVEGLNRIPSFGLTDQVMLAYEVQKIIIKQQNLSLLCFVDVLIKFLDTAKYPYMNEVKNCIFYIHKQTMELFGYTADELQKLIEKNSLSMVAIICQTKTMLSPTFPFALFAKGFFVESQFDIPKCVALKKGKNDEIKEVSFNNFVQTLCSWFNGEYLTDPIGKSEISTIRPVDI